MRELRRSWSRLILVTISVALGSSCLLLFTALGNGLQEFYKKIEMGLPGINQIDFDNQHKLQADGTWEKITEGKLPEISYKFPLELKKEIRVPFLYFSSNHKSENGIKLPFALNAQILKADNTELLPADGTVTRKAVKNVKNIKSASERYQSSEQPENQIPENLKINIGWIRDINLKNPNYLAPEQGRMPKSEEMAITLCPELISKLNPSWQGLDKVKWLGKKVRLHVTYLQKKTLDPMMAFDILNVGTSLYSIIGTIDQDLEIVGVTNLPNDINEPGFQRDMFNPNHISSYSALISSSSLEKILKPVDSPELIVNFSIENASNAAVRLGMLNRVEGEDLGENPREMLRQMLVDQGIDPSELKVTRSVIVVKDPTQLPRFRKIIESKGFKTFSFYDRFKGIKRLGGVITFTASVLGMVALVISALSITATLLLTVNQRMSEFGIMRALGAKRIHILLSMLFEAGFTGIVAGIVGIFLAYTVGVALDFRLNLILQTTEGLSQFLFDTKTLSIFRLGFKPELFGLGLSVTIFTCVLAALLPSFRASNIDPIQALRHE